FLYPRRERGSGWGRQEEQEARASSRFPPATGFTPYVELRTSLSALLQNDKTQGDGLGSRQAGSFLPLSPRRHNHFALRLACPARQEAEPRSRNGRTISAASERGAGEAVYRYTRTLECKDALRETAKSGQTRNRDLEIWDDEP